jgi:hypothetical protein
MNLYYAERYGDQDAGEPYIVERGVFTSIKEFAPYRLQGWSGTKELNAETDRYLQQQQAAQFPPAPPITPMSMPPYLTVPPHVSVFVRPCPSVSVGERPCPSILEKGNANA